MHNFLLSLPSLLYKLLIKYNKSSVYFQKSIKSVNVFSSYGAEKTFDIRCLANRLIFEFENQVAGQTSNVKSFFRTVPFGP